MICMYDRNEQCFEDCPTCPRSVSEPDPDDVRDWEMEEEEDEYE